MPKVGEGLARLRAWWLWRQGLTPATAPTSVAACLAQAGWLATSGSTGVYLSIRARIPGLSREAVDRAAIDGLDVVEVPGGHARPSVIVPRAEMGLALRLHLASYARHAAPLIASGRLNEAALERIGAQVCRALDEGPLSTAGIRASVTAPDAGELLVGALASLAVRGVIRRFPVTGRLDASAYMYELQHPDDRPDLDAEGDAAAVTLRATRQFLRRHGPATVDEVTGWSALTKGAVRKALGALGAEPVPMPGWTDEAWLLPEDRGAWTSFTGDVGDRIVFLPYRDPFVHVRRPPAVLAGRAPGPVLNAALEPVSIRDIVVLHHHVIVAGGAIVGVWDYDPEGRGVATRVWSTDKRLRVRVADAAADTGRFIRQQLGDAKLSGVDPPARRALRIAFCHGPASVRGRG